MLIDEAGGCGVVVNLLPAVSLNSVVYVLHALLFLHALTFLNIWVIRLIGIQLFTLIIFIVSKINY